MATPTSTRQTLVDTFQYAKVLPRQLIEYLAGADLTDNAQLWLNLICRPEVDDDLFEQLLRAERRGSNQSAQWTQPAETVARTVRELRRGGDVKALAKDVVDELGDRLPHAQAPIWASAPAGDRHVDELLAAFLPLAPVAVVVAIGQRCASRSPFIDRNWDRALMAVKAMDVCMSDWSVRTDAARRPLEAGVSFVLGQVEAEAPELWPAAVVQLSHPALLRKAFSGVRRMSVRTNPVFADTFAEYLLGPLLAGQFHRRLTYARVEALTVKFAPYWSSSSCALLTNVVEQRLATSSADTVQRACRAVAELVRARALVLAGIPADLSALSLADALERSRTATADWVVASARFDRPDQWAAMLTMADTMPDGVRLGDLLTVAGAVGTDR